MERFLLNLWVVGGTAVGGTAVGGTVMDTSDAMLSVAIDVTYLKHISKSDRKSTRLNSSHVRTSRMPSSA